jgi:hypothetical protein
MSKKNWSYCDGNGCQYVNMSCTACRKPITEGAFRYCKKGIYDEQTQYQHKGCSSADPYWAQRELEMKQAIAFTRERLAAYMAFRDAWGESGLDAQIEEMTNYLNSDQIRAFEQVHGIGSGITVLTAAND